MTDSPLRFSSPLVLASRSPRRLHLLRGLGLEPAVAPSEVPEHQDPLLSPEALVQKLALDKAKDVSGRYRECLVLGADTLVVLNGRVLGKPADQVEARSMLSRLSGETHRVYTGIALVHAASDRRHQDVACTEVTFGRLEDHEIARYVQGGSPMDKAGAYGIQDDSGALFVESIRGDYYNVVGLPLRTLYRLVVREFSDLLVA